MALPKIDVPTFNVNILGTEKSIRCRPFVVKENNMLTLAVASENKMEMLQTCKQVLTNCCIDEIDINSLAMYQLQDLFLKVKIKSVGEIQSFELICGSCENKINYDMNLNDFKVAGKTDSDTLKIEFNENSGMVLKYPSAEVFANTEDLSDIEILINSIDYIYDDVEITKPNQDNYQEFVEFVDSLPLDKYSEAEQFFAYMPTLVHNIEYVCTKCETPNKIILNGYEHFFG